MNAARDRNSPMFPPFKKPWRNCKKSFSIEHESEKNKRGIVEATTTIF